MAITHCATLIEADHGIVFLKDADNEVHALEFGEHHEEEKKHDHHDATHKHIDHHSKTKEHHHDEKHDHATHTKNYGIHCWSPIGSRPGKLDMSALSWTKVENAQHQKEKVEELNKQLKHEWHQHKGDKLFHDAQSFIDHVKKELNL